MTTARLVNHNGCAEPEIGSCTEILKSMYQAYIDILSGQNVVEMQTADFRKVSYGPGNVHLLIREYNSLWDECGAGSGLPKIGTHRGGPAVLSC